MNKTLFPLWQKISALCGLVTIAGSVLLTIRFGASINNALGFGLGSFFLILGACYRLMPRWLRWCCKAAISGMALFFLLMSGLMVSAGARNTATFTEDAVIVLGSGIRGERIPVMLQRRLEGAQRYLQANPRAIVLVTGGQGYGEDIPEALAMQRALLAAGIEAHQILLEDQSRNTDENFANSKKILNKHFGGQTWRVSVVTSDFHMFRALATARRHGLDATSFNAPLDWYLRPGSFLRESLSIVKFWFW
ncbi:hypothetical protein AGMMS49545_06580 [Betaproteobacteria bacterium]|nr:hypothetical protein AGMMS49545_06580 [Betaproteobacteria bacterium]GHU44862.1 hypothetical protein AGMMS50289_14270 [Betaproteobacteria bacterium]